MCGVHAEKDRAELVSEAALVLGLEKPRENRPELAANAFATAIRTN
jgi:hypothetical protein